MPVRCPSVSNFRCTDALHYSPQNSPGSNMCSANKVVQMDTVDEADSEIEMDGVDGMKATGPALKRAVSSGKPREGSGAQDADQQAHMSVLTANASASGMLVS